MAKGKKRGINPDSKLNAAIGERLHKMRLKRDLTQFEVAEGVGYSPSGYSLIENGATTPSAGRLRDLAVFFKCSVDYLLGLRKRP